MFYVKATIGEDTIKVELTDENVFNTCPNCGMETPVDLSVLANDGDFDLFSLAVFCQKCSATHHTPKEPIHIYQ